MISAEISGHIDLLDERIRQVREQIQKHIDDDPGLHEQRELLLSIPGIGEKTVAALLSYFAEISKFSSAKQLASFVGVTPR